MLSSDILQMNGYSVRGSNSAISCFVPLFNIGQLLKERICSYRSKFFPLRVDLLLERLHLQGKQTGSQETYFPCKMAEKYGMCLSVYPFTLYFSTVLQAMAELEDAEPEGSKEEAPELSASQRARIERNRQKALLLRESRLQAHPYATDHLG